MKTSFLRWGACAIFLLSLALLPRQAVAQGVFLRGFGAVNESVGSVATGMPLDGGGALYWNPAAISALENNEISVGLGIVLPESTVESKVVLSSNGETITGGSTKSSAGSVPVPTMSFIWRRCPKSKTTFGLGMGAVGGAASLYAADTPGTFNPVLAGRSKSASIVILQVTPTVSYQVTDKLSIGAAPLIDLASLQINPMQLGQPASDEIHNYGTRYAYGGGFQVGAFYDFKNHFKAGFMYKSPIWAEPLHYEGTYFKDDSSASGSFELDLPMTLSFGFSYDGFKDTVIGMDVRYFDYAHARGFKQGIDINDNNKVKGVDWDSIFSIAVGVERKINDKIKVRMGYVWNENPIPSRSAALNVADPLLMQHTLSFGATYAIQKNLEFTFAYSHCFKAKESGRFETGAGTYGVVTNSAYANAMMAGITKKW